MTVGAALGVAVVANVPGAGLPSPAWPWSAPRPGTASSRARAVPRKMLCQVRAAETGEGQICHPKHRREWRSLPRPAAPQAAAAPTRKLAAATAAPAARCSFASARGAAVPATTAALTASWLAAATFLILLVPAAVGSTGRFRRVSPDSCLSARLGSHSRTGSSRSFAGSVLRFVLQGGL